MNRGELVEFVVRGLGPGASRAAADRAIGAVLGAIQRGLKKEGKVTLVGFGTFFVRKRRAREGRDPRNGAPIRIAASRTVGFHAGLVLRRSV
jgi:DNA-binding protein HU-beta